MKLPFLLSGLLALAATAAEPAIPNDEQLLRQQAAAWDEAIWRKDEPAIMANIGEGFRHVDARGDASAKAQFVADLLDPALHIEPYTVEHLEVRLLGDTALLTGETVMTGTYAEKPFRSHYRYVDVYHRRAGRWAVVYIQITKLPE